MISPMVIPPAVPASPFLTPQGSTPLRRSIANRAIATAITVMERLHVPLPPFAFFTPEQWTALAADSHSAASAAEVRDCMLGWDVTDFGSRKFHELGRTLFTLRNGIASNPRYPKPYAEKFLIEPEGQRSPIHYHVKKREDIINRGGGNIIVCLHTIGNDSLPCPHGTIEVSIDGFRRTVRAGDKIRLRPGKSVSIPPSTFHQFWAEPGTGLHIDGIGYTISGEVSSVCDDWRDNHFIDPWANRFPGIIEDTPATHLLCHEYPRP
ncbi:ABC-type sugar transport system, auxiliary component [Opitutaceae bacterium TAV1]|nr:ABC-type sugar transport system, auxiliary component [Opitutaceae bacterium TAV1]